MFILHFLRYKTKPSDIKNRPDLHQCVHKSGELNKGIVKYLN